jgi:Phytanoyl-CoA dioxygenase (PhyH)
MIKKIVRFFTDIYRFKKDNRFVISRSSYIIMRRLDMYSLGFTTKLLKMILAPRQYRTLDKTTQELKHSGFLKLGNFSGPYLEELLGFNVFCRGKTSLSGKIDAVEKPASALMGRVDIQDRELLSSKAVAEFIVNAPFLHIAKKHYGREVICVRSNAWWSIPTSYKGSLDGSAQKFHRDIDWLGELKFFIFATDVTPSNGPLDFIMKSHRKRLDGFMLTDGRIEEADMFRVYDKKKYLASTLCKKGDVFVVDTRGYHRGRPLIEGRRCVLSVEFSVNQFGAAAQYSPRPVLNPAWPSYAVWKEAIAKDAAWAGLFNQEIGVERSWQAAS